MDSCLGDGSDPNPEITTTRFGSDSRFCAIAMAYVVRQSKKPLVNRTIDWICMVLPEESIYGDERRRSPMSRPKNSLSGSRRSATLVHRFVRMRFLYFTNIGFGYCYFTALARSSHHAGMKICFRYSRSSTIISHRTPSFTSAGVLRALANPNSSNKF